MSASTVLSSLIRGRMRPNMQHCSNTTTRNVNSQEISFLSRDSQSQESIKTRLGASIYSWWWAYKVNASLVVGDSKCCRIHWFLVAPLIQYADAWNVVSGCQQVLIKVISLIGGGTLLQSCWSSALCLLPVSGGGPLCWWLVCSNPTRTLNLSLNLNPKSVWHSGHLPHLLFRHLELWNIAI